MSFLDVRLNEHGHLKAWAPSQSHSAATITSCMRLSPPGCLCSFQTAKMHPVHGAAPPHPVVTSGTFCKGLSSGVARAVASGVAQLHSDHEDGLENDLPRCKRHSSSLSSFWKWRERRYTRSILLCSRLPSQELPPPVLEASGELVNPSVSPLEVTVSVTPSGNHVTSA